MMQEAVQMFVIRTFCWVGGEKLKKIEPGMRNGWWSVEEVFPRHEVTPRSGVIDSSYYSAV